MIGLCRDQLFDRIEYGTYDVDPQTFSPQTYPIRRVKRDERRTGRLRASLLQRGGQGSAPLGSAPSRTAARDGMRLGVLGGNDCGDAPVMPRRHRTQAKTE